MNYRNYLNDIYKDFFNDPLIETKKEVVGETINAKETSLDNSYVEKIDELYITDDSKDLLKKIIKYMDDYAKGKEKLYINFNILLETDNKLITEEITSLINKYAIHYKYIDNSNKTFLSLYKLDNVELLNKSFKENSFVVITDLDAFNMNDTMIKNKLLHALKDNLLNKCITIIADKKDSLKTFLLNDDSLVRDYYSFKLTAIKPDTNDIYNNIINKLSTDILNDEFRVEILDYINETYPKNNLDYVRYTNNLLKHISFNKTIPLIDTIKDTKEIFKDLNELVGLKKVKKSLNELVDLISLKNKTADDLKINNINLHMVFLGNPGTGKTTVARMLCGILYDLKYISQNKLIEVSPKDLVAEYVGQTGPKTMSVIDKAMGGLLFIDEAYTLADRGDNSYNAEAIATLIKAMEDYRDKLVVILAGYTKEMQGFLDSNSGIVSRIGYTLEFDDYNEEELKEIFKGMLTKSGFVISSLGLDKFSMLVQENKNTKNFGNARFARNVYEKTILRHATNTKNKKQSKVLKTITEDDVCYE